MSKKNITPINREMVMDESEIIISKTDPKGKITYGNRVFMRYSGFPEKEIIGVQHNIVRHPDMPRAVFKLFWDTIQKKEEIFAYVKNISQDGSFYWVLANVTPSLDADGRVLGYYSVRRKPNPKAIQVVSQLYSDMLHAEKIAGSRDAIETSNTVLAKFLSDRKVSYEKMIFSLQAL